MHVRETHTLGTEAVRVGSWHGAIPVVTAEIAPPKIIGENVDDVGQSRRRKCRWKGGQGLAEIPAIHDAVYRRAGLHPASRFRFRQQNTILPTNAGLWITIAASCCVLHTSLRFS